MPGSQLATSQQTQLPGIDFPYPSNPYQPNVAIDTQNPSSLTSFAFQLPPMTSENDLDLPEQVMSVTNPKAKAIVSEKAVIKVKHEKEPKSARAKKEPVAKKPAHKGRKLNSRNFSRGEIYALLDLITQLLPIRLDAWKEVEKRYNSWAHEHECVERTHKSLRQKFDTVMSLF